MPKTIMRPHKTSLELRPVSVERSESPLRSISPLSVTTTVKDQIREAQMRALQTYIPKSKLVKDVWRTIREKANYGIQFYGDSAYMGEVSP